MLSSFSIISLIGVMLGVLVLVVVMAVYAGLERNVKERLLGYMPHVLLNENFPTSEDGRMVEWETTAAMARKLPHVQSATAFVYDYVMVDVEDRGQRAVLFRGIDTSDPAQVEGITKMLALDTHPKSSADLGLDDRVVISSLIAEEFKIGVGDKIRLLSTKNLKEIMAAYKASDNPPLREAYAGAWTKSTETLRTGWMEDGGKFVLSAAIYREVYTALVAIYDDGIGKNSIREQEQELLGDLLRAMDSAEQTETEFRFEPDAKLEVEKAISDLNATDVEKLNNEAFKGLKKAVLPKDAIVSGVYQASQMAVSPDLFVPLPLAQNLAGLDQAVQGIALRLDDPYLAESFAAEARNAHPEWSLTTWGQQAKPFFDLIENQRAMMYFMLSFIVLISAFSMMAVMFTITIQKRREIGVMKALGAAPSQIVRVFLYQGMILGTLGAVLGVCLGRVVIHFRGELQAVLRSFDFDPFTSDFTGFTVLPAHNNPVEQAVFAIMAFVLCSLAAFVPAFFAARSDAAKSLRNL
jgi:lipoprotein-releasing system permease protein